MQLSSIKIVFWLGKIKKDNKPIDFLLKLLYTIFVSGKGEDAYKFQFYARNKVWLTHETALYSV